MYLGLPLIIAGLVLSSTATPVESKNLPRCAQPWFDHLLYDCYPNGVLCPKLAGTPQKPCGEACYSPNHYSCKDDRLQELKPYNDAFQLVVSNPQRLPPGNYSTKVQACGRHFWLQDGPACTYCPDVVRQQAGSCPDGKDTVFVGSSGMNTIVPGGQRYYVEPNGALGFSQAHSGQSPTGSFSGVNAYENGAFLVNGLVNWLACPTMSVGKHYQIFAPLPGVKFDNGCIPVNLLVRPQNGSANVWQYV